MTQHSARRSAVVAFALSVALITAIAPAPTVEAAPVTQGGLTTSAEARIGGVPAAAVVAGERIQIVVTVTSVATTRALVDIEVVDGAGQAHQRFFDDELLRAGRPRTFSTTWTVPVGASAGDRVVKVGIFDPGWTALRHWNDGATSFRVTASPPPTPPPPTTTSPPTTTTADGDHDDDLAADDEHDGHDGAADR